MVGVPSSLRDKCNKIFHLGRYIVSFTVGNFIYSSDHDISDRKTDDSINIFQLHHFMAMGSGHNIMALPLQSFITTLNRHMIMIMTN